MRQHKYTVLVLAFLVLTTASGTMSLASVERYQTLDALQDALDDASTSYRSGRGLFFVKNKREAEVQEAEAALQKVGKQKHDVRMAIASNRETIVNFRENFGIDATNSGAILALVEKEQENLFSFMRYLQARSLFRGINPSDIGVTLLRKMIHTTLGEITDASIRDNVIQRARLRLFRVVLRARELGGETIVLTKRHQELLEQYALAQEEVDLAGDNFDAAVNRIAEVQRVVEEVHAQVLRLQSELARIDARLRAKAERNLIEMGLMDGQPGTRSDGAMRGTQVFNWPVRGRISAGFMNKSYERFFGVPHRGTDIVVSQGTPVFAAAEGIVFLARHGGARGYSYVLVGHRNGYATLYGHLSKITVSNGQEISAGQAVGLSGGAPGTSGSGPMTTGSHLHFEVIKNGAHVNPMSVLR